MSLTLAMNVTEGDKPRSERRMRWLGNSARIQWMAVKQRLEKDTWGLLFSGRWAAAMVSGADKGAECCCMSAGRGGGVGMDDGVHMSVCVRSVLAKEEDGGVGEWCWLVSNTVMR